MSASHKNKKTPYLANPKIICQLGPPKNKSLTDTKTNLCLWTKIKNKPALELGLDQDYEKSLLMNYMHREIILNDSGSCDIINK